MPIGIREVTPRMVEANRQNAQKCTRPRTPEGKERVAYNALQHDLYGKHCLQFMLAADEDPKEHQQILAGLELKPSRRAFNGGNSSPNVT